MMLSFIVKGEPIPQGSMRSLGRGRMTSDNPRLKSWRRDVALAADIAVRESKIETVGYDYEVKLGNRIHHLTRQVCYDEPVVVWAAFFFAPPQRPRWGDIHGTKPDLDKLQRAIGDALEMANVVSNDSRICGWPEFHGKRYSDEQRVEISVVTVRGAMQSA